MSENYVLVSDLNGTRDSQEIEEAVRSTSMKVRASIEYCVGYADDEYWIPVLVVE